MTGTNGLEVLAKIPGLYEVPKLRNLIFFVAQCALGGSWICEVGLGGLEGISDGIYSPNGYEK